MDIVGGTPLALQRFQYHGSQLQLEPFDINARKLHGTHGGMFMLVTFLPGLERSVCTENVLDIHVKEMVFGALVGREVQDERVCEPAVFVKLREPARGRGADGSVGTRPVDRVAWTRVEAPEFGVKEPELDVFGDGRAGHRVETEADATVRVARS